jgi:hypothetical protein
VIDWQKIMVDKSAIRHKKTGRVYCIVGEDWTAGIKMYELKKIDDGTTYHMTEGALNMGAVYCEWEVVDPYAEDLTAIAKIVAKHTGQQLQSAPTPSCCDKYRGGGWRLCQKCGKEL